MSEQIVQNARCKELSEQITDLYKQLKQKKQETEDLRAGIVPISVDSSLSDAEKQRYEDEIASIQSQQAVLVDQVKDSARAHFELKEIRFQKRIDELNAALANKQSQLELLQATCNQEKSNHQKLHQEYTAQSNKHRDTISHLHARLDSSEKKINKAEQQYANAVFALSDQQKAVQKHHPRFILMFFLSLFIFLAGLLIGVSAVYLWVNSEKAITIIEQPIHHTKIVRIQEDCPQLKPKRRLYQARKAQNYSSKILKVVNSDDPLAGL